MENSSNSCEGISDHTFSGSGASRCFASISESCAPTLRYLRIVELEYFVWKFRGEFEKLDLLSLEGRGAKRCRVSAVPHRCHSSEKCGKASVTTTTTPTSTATNRSAMSNPTSGGD
eukprot:GHVU01125086.1.p3 GENE.GHVU01125086.1~~GHVU01125086.1.p3  ORF type:complete len:116 (-),score=11.15 GHVU01125086.1:869-1216(-)